MAVEPLSQISADAPKQSVDQNILRPFRAPAGLALFPGLKPQAESYSPFGTSLPQNQKAGQKLSRIPVHIFEATSTIAGEYEYEGPGDAPDLRAAPLTA